MFLIGPRQTGKSTYLRTHFPKARYVDLLEAETFRELSLYPETLRQKLRDDESLIIVDEIQKLPSLLDEIQLLIDRNPSLRFILTGSSARKLRRGKVNLLGGRALFIRFHPLMSSELDYERTLDRLNWGSLPAVIDSPFPSQDLNSYVGVYLKEEIQAESLTRSIENFSRFLHFSSYLNTQQINYTKIGNDAQIPVRTVRDYFDVLKDTLIADLLPSFQETKKRKAVATEKCFFFDTGVARSLARHGLIAEGTTEFGHGLEHLIYLELISYKDYSFKDFQLSYWRTLSQIEVDFLIDDHIAIEVKASTRVSTQDLKGLKALGEELTLKRAIVISNEKEKRKVSGIEIIPYKEFLRSLWNGEII